MALRLSTALRNFLNRDGSLKRAFHGGIIEIYSGSQPVTADAAIAGTLLATITAGSGAHTDETRSTGSVELTGGGSGSIDTLTVDGVSIIDNVVPFNTSLAQTASDLADEINSSLSTPEYRASVSSQTVTIEAMPATGTTPNGLVVASTVTTITKTDNNMASGVDAVNGLKFGDSVAGVLSKLASQAWSGVAGASGTAGWFRFISAEDDAGAADSSAEKIRLDGSIATSGAQLNMSSTAIASGATQTINSFALTLPAS